jgi:hypothetical protein
MKKIALPSYPLRAVHLVTVWAYAVSQPVFALLEANPEFLVVRGSTRVEVAVFAVLLVFGPPLLALAAQLLVRLASTRVADVLHLAFLGVFVVPLALQLLNAFDPGSVVAVLGAAGAACLAVLVYVRFKAARLFLAFSMALPLIGLGTFVLGIPLATADDAAGAKLTIASKTPVVMVVLDEFPVSSLLAADGGIDAARYPNFARLAREGTWYSRATTVHEHTTHAVPAMLDGKLPDPDALPTLSDHADNLFTLLGESYEFRVVEPVTHLCPRRYCSRKPRGSVAHRLTSLASDVRVAYLHRVLPTSLAHGLPAVGDRWGGFGDDPVRAAPRDLILGASNKNQVDHILAATDDAPQHDFGTLLASIRRNESRRTLHFLHLLLPHRPWRTLPSGRYYGNSEGIDGTVGDARVTWLDDPWLVQQGYQRHLLQVGYVDRLLGRILDRLVKSGLYDDALVVLTADHGMSFVAGGETRTVNPQNIADIARVPLFVKYPGQRDGGTDTREAQTIDILPTIADALDVRLPWAVDGRSLLETGEARGKVVLTGRDGRLVEASSEEIDRGVRSTLRRKSALFGESGDSLYDIGSNRHLLGRPLAGMSTQRSSTARVVFDGEELLANVHLSSSFVPARITGFIEGIGRDIELALALNGRIAALTRSYQLNGRQVFSAVVPEATFLDGPNRVELLSIHGTRSAPRLITLGETRVAQQYDLAADGRSIGLPDGRRALVEAGRITGELESWVHNADAIRLRGWAADLHAGSLPDRILVFASGQLLYAGETTVYRWNIRETYGRAGLERAGWVVELPTSELRSKQVRIFAVRGSTASELPRPVAFPWS